MLYVQIEAWGGCRWSCDSAHVSFLTYFYPEINPEICRWGNVTPFYTKLVEVRRSLCHQLNVGTMTTEAIKALRDAG